MEDLRVEEDEDTRFTKNGIKERINAEIDAEIENLNENYNVKEESDDIKAYLHKKGSRFDGSS